MRTDVNRKGDSLSVHVRRVKSYGQTNASIRCSQALRKLSETPSYSLQNDFLHCSCTRKAPLLLVQLL